MRTIPILFSTAMVQALLDGRKTQTRRTNGLEEVNHKPDEWTYAGFEFGVHHFKPSYSMGHHTAIAERHPQIKCPYGQPGDKDWQTGMPPKDGYYFVKDEFEEKPVYLRVFPQGLDDIKTPFITWGWNQNDDPECISSDGGPTPENIMWKRPGDVLWVRETWCPITPSNFNRQTKYIYASTVAQNKLNNNKWKPNIHMPKKACRLFLKVKSVRVERLQDITEEDAVSEGIEMVHNGGLVPGYRNYLEGTIIKGSLLPKVSFRSLWYLLNGVGSWNANPWVWVVEFERTEKPANWPNQ